MIKGKGLNELRKYRLELISRGIAAGEIPDEAVFGHYLFCIKDPDEKIRRDPLNALRTLAREYGDIVLFHVLMQARILHCEVRRLPSNTF